MTGLNYLKDGQDPVALKDEEYPEWLWECLDVMKKADNAEEDIGDEFCTLIPLVLSRMLTPSPPTWMLTSEKPSRRRNVSWRPSAGGP